MAIFLCKTAGGAQFVFRGKIYTRHWTKQELRRGGGSTIKSLGIKYIIPATSRYRLLAKSPTTIKYISSNLEERLSKKKSRGGRGRGEGGGGVGEVCLFTLSNSCGAALLCTAPARMYACDAIPSPCGGRDGPHGTAAQSQVLPVVATNRRL